MMTRRILTASIALPILIFIVWLGGLWFAALIAVAAGVGAWELCQLATAVEKRPLMPVAVLLAIGLSISYHFIPAPRHPENMEFIAMVPALAAILAAIVLLRVQSLRGLSGRLLATLCIALIIGGTLLHAPILRDLEFFPNELSLGIRWILFLLGVTFAADTTAYFTDRAIGSRRLRLDKTWRGAIGGILAAVVCGVVISSALGLSAPAQTAAVASIILAIVGHVGAKFIIQMKRTAGVEYTGRLLPGYGGILDRMGSLMWSLVILYHLVALASGSTA